MPQISVEAEALAEARAALEIFHDRVAPEFQRGFLWPLMQGYARRSPRGMLHLIDLARHGEDDAHAVLMDMATDIMNRHEALPAFLGTYVAENLNGFTSRRRGRRKKDHLVRDAWIAFLVGDLALAFHIRPTRNSTVAHRESASSIVSRAGNETRIAPIGEKAVERIYQKYWPIIAPTNPDYRFRSWRALKPS